jgi:rare lipoprotein A
VSGEEQTRQGQTSYEFQRILHGRSKKGEKNNFSRKMGVNSSKPREVQMNTLIMHCSAAGSFQKLFTASLLAFVLSACGASKSAFTESGQGSYYADKFNGRATTSGEIYRPGRLTAAHNTLPFGTKIKVTNTRNGHSVKVVVNDRGPHAKGRIVDVSKRAARKLDLIDAGVIPVRLEVLHMGPVAHKGR